MSLLLDSGFLYALIDADVDSHGEQIERLRRGEEP